MKSLIPYSESILLQVSPSWTTWYWQQSLFVPNGTGAGGVVTHCGAIVLLANASDIDKVGLSFMLLTAVK